MKKIITALLLVLVLFSGCATKRIILVPQAEYYPTFPTSTFNKSEKYSLKIWEESQDVNGTTENYLVAEKKDALGFIRNTKELRGNYNVLLSKIIEFNLKIKEQNKIQNTKKPVEIDDIDNSWFK